MVAAVGEFVMTGGFAVAARRCIHVFTFFIIVEEGPELLISNNPSIDQEIGRE